MKPGENRLSKGHSGTDHAWPGREGGIHHRNARPGSGARGRSDSRAHESEMSDGAHDRAKLFV